MGRTLGQLGLELEPTPAMLAGTQHVWQHSWCGTVVVIPDNGRPGACPNIDCARTTDAWWEQTIGTDGLAGLRETRQTDEPCSDGSKRHTDMNPHGDAPQPARPQLDLVRPDPSHPTIRDVLPGRRTTS